MKTTTFIIPLLSLGLFSPITALSQNDAQATATAECNKLSVITDYEKAIRLSIRKEKPLFIYAYDDQ